MPASEQSIRLTDAYRERVALLQQRATEQAAGRWGTVSLGNLDRTHEAWVAAIVPTLEVFQRAGSTLTVAYLTAFIASELGRAPAAPPPALAPVGVSDDGRPLATALMTSLIAVKAALKEGREPATALELGKVRATRMAGAATIFTPRAEMDAQTVSMQEIVGWRRVTFGGCGACLAAATGAVQHEREILKVHDHCRCTKEPVVRDVTETVARSTGPEIFAAMGRAEQDKALGPAAAQAVREGRIAWPELIGVSPMEERPDMLTQAPLAA